MWVAMDATVTSPRIKGEILMEDLVRDHIALIPMTIDPIAALDQY